MILLFEINQSAGRVIQWKFCVLNQFTQTDKTLAKTLKIPIDVSLQLRGKANDAVFLYCYLDTHVTWSIWIALAKQLGQSLQQ